MTTSLVTGAPRRKWRLERLGGWGESAGFGAVVAVLAALVAYLVFAGYLVPAAFLALAPIAIWLMTMPLFLVIAVGASLPALMSVTGNTGGYHVAMSDLLLVMAVAAILLAASVEGSSASIRALGPIAGAVVPYSLLVLILWLFHPGVREAAQSVQRYELFVFPLIAGAFVAFNGEQRRVLTAYVFATTFLALIWPFVHFGMQKNPVGQLFTNAILLLIAMPSLRRLMPCLVILVPGLLFTESRGAIGSAIVGVGVIAMFNRFSSRSIWNRILPLAALAALAFVLMPASLRTRVTTLTPGINTRAAYSLHIRQELSADAHLIIARHPWTGVGIGNYALADRQSSQPSDDPHEVLLLQAAEGGYGLAVLYVLLIAGSTTVLFMRMRSLPVAAAAAAVLLATAIHGLVDVYWVRGTPVLGWLLVGMACGELARRRNGGLREG